MTDQERDIICRAAAQDLAGVLKLVSAVAAGETRPLLGAPLAPRSLPLAPFATPALDAVRSMSRQEQIEAMARDPRIAFQMAKEDRRASRKKKAA